MQNSLRELFEDLSRAALLAREATEAGEYGIAQNQCRTVMGTAGKLFTRLAVLDEFADDARWMAEVDRGLKRSRASEPRPIPGDTPLPFASDPGRKPPRPRKTKGEG